MAKTDWRNRIVGHGEEDPEQLLANPWNWRVHSTYQQQVIAGSLDEVGWVDAIKVNRITGHVVDGHARVAIAISQRQKKVPVEYLELTEVEERLILATLDPIASLAGQDDEMLDTLLSDIESQNADMSEFLDELMIDLDLAGDIERQLNEGNGSGRGLGEKSKQIKVVLYSDHVDVFERAILATGLKNRAEALALICEAYLNEERQFDIPTESDFAPADA